MEVKTPVTWKEGLSGRTFEGKEESRMRELDLARARWNGSAHHSSPFV